MPTHTKPGRPDRADDVIIRERTAADDEAIRRLNDAAFGGTCESRLVEELRVAGHAEIELVAMAGTELVGHLLTSTLDVVIAGHAIRALALAPMSVEPGRHRRGIGAALVRAAMREAQQRAWQVVIVLGHPDYYPRFGFSAALARPLASPFPGAAFMALELVPGALSGGAGRVVHPPAFGVTS